MWSSASSVVASSSSVSSYVKKGHHPSADDGPWCFSLFGLMSSADLCDFDDDKGNQQPDAHVDRDDDGTANGGNARHKCSPITAPRPKRVKFIVFLML